MAKAVACTKGRARTQVRLTPSQKVEGSSRPESPVARSCSKPKQVQREDLGVLDEPVDRGCGHLVAEDLTPGTLLDAAGGRMTRAQLVQ
jgi:hypothetical protein